MIKLSEFSGVMFDLDGVITDTARFHFLGWKKMADDLSIPFDEKDNEQLKGVDRITSLEKILALGNVDLPMAEKKRLAQIKNTYYRELINDISQADILPGVIDLLEYLRSMDKKISIASASQNAPSIINNLGLDEYFDHIADASLARSKPYPDIFLFAAYGAGLHPATCIGLEDSIAGLQSIKASSMLAIGVGGQELMDDADVFVKDLLNLKFAD